MKNKEIKGLSEQELIEKIRDGKAGLNKMKLNHTISPIENPAKIRLERRNIARMKTEAALRKREAKKATDTKKTKEKK